MPLVEVEPTGGCLAPEPYRRAFDVLEELVRTRGMRRIDGLHARLRRRYPKGFNPESASREESARIMRIQAEVAQTQERGRGRSA